VRSRWAIDPERNRAAAVGHAFAMLVAEYHECGAEFGGRDGQALVDELGDCCWALTALCIALDVAMPTVADATAAQEVTPEWLWLGALADSVQHWYQEGPSAVDDEQLPDADDEPMQWPQPRMGGSGTDTDHVPRHVQLVTTFWIGQLPVASAEWRHLVAAGDDD
jgi:hypothetical protein